MYDIENLTVAYDEAPVLENISLRIREGEKAVIIGPSGAGKSTLLKKLYELRQERCAFIHQDYALVPQLSAFLNVYAGKLDRTTTLSNLLNLVRPQHHALDDDGAVRGAQVAMDGRAVARIRHGHFRGCPRELAPRAGARAGHVVGKLGSRD